MTIFTELQNAGLPVISASENGSISMGAMTPAQDAVYKDILLAYFSPALWADIQLLRTDKQQIKDAYQTMIARLEQIQAATSPTNAQVIQAIRDEALYIERIMKVLLRLL